MAEFEGDDERIHDQASLLKCLDALPADRRGQAVVALAARATLRVLPLIERSTVEPLLPPLSQLAFALFWMEASAWTTAKNPSHAAELRASAFAYAEFLSPASAFNRSATTLNGAAGAVVRSAATAALAADHPTSQLSAFVANAVSSVASSLPAAPHVQAAGGTVVSPPIFAANAASSVSRFGSFDIWRSISDDALVLSAGRLPSGLAGEPLWPQGAPDWATKHWARLRDLLTEAHWQPWLDWYQRRLDGVELSEEIEILFATLPVDPQKKDPAEQNALLAQEIAQLTAFDSSATETRRSSEVISIADMFTPKVFRAASLPKPSVPKRKPAAIEPITRDGKIRLQKGPAKADLDARALNAALRALRQQFIDLVADLDAESNIDKRATASLRRVSDLIPTKRPTQEQLFRLAHEQEKLESYAASVVEEWPRMLAADYLAATRAFDRTVRQFPKWREFKSNAEKDRLTTEQREAAPSIAAEFADALRETEVADFVEQEIASIVGEMASRLTALREAEAARFDPIAAGADLLAEDLVASMENVVKAIAEAAITSTAGVTGTAKRRTMKFASRASKSIDKELDRLADGVGPALTRSAKYALLGGAGYAGTKTGAITTVIHELMRQFPQIEEWLRPVLNFLS